MIQPPRAKKINGDYAWLREKDQPEVLAYLKQENAYTESVMAGTAELQKQLFDELKGRIKETDQTVPAKLDDYYYYSRTEAGKQYEIYCRQKGNLVAPEEILLDLNVLASDLGLAYLRLGVFSISPDHRYLAYSLDTDGSESFLLRVKDLTTGQLLPEEIHGTYYTLAWANDSQAFFYTVFDAAHRPHRVFKHRLAAPPGTDLLIYEETKPGFNVWLRKTRSRRLIFIEVENQTMTESWWLDADLPSVPPRLLEPRRPDLEYFPDHHPDGDTLFILTNDGAPDFRLMAAPVDAPGRSRWREVVPARPGVILKDFEVFKTHLVLELLENTQPQFEVINLATWQRGRLRFTEPVYTLASDLNLEFTTDCFRFVYSSFITPETVYDYYFATGEQTLRKREELPSGYEPSHYESERLWAEAADGVRIPISLVYRQPLALDGSRPLLLYGYGAYEEVIEAGFSATRISLLDRGVIFAIAHVRGGGELGRGWYEQGKFLHKKNTFTDFIAAAEFLIRSGYTKAERLVALGRSAGGLLMGAVANLRPDLFQTIVAGVPFVDVLNTMLDPTLPLTEQEYGEWGDPRQPEFYDYIKSYSPYDNILPQNYPHILVTAGLHDPRVNYWEPTKWVAKLRELKTDDNLLLLKTNLGAGHIGPSGRYDALRDLAFEDAFILKTLGLLG
ncbi:MAG: S9 family peptidase [Candidatus Vogelbacteria bacterium]|nr:S9 family peptidase [Candidatus Vogelbacteria bacterium]